MAYTTLQVGVTGPEGRIGAGTEYHIDTKYSRNLPWEEVVKAFDAKATRYGQDGRNIVFSNQGVHGTPYKVNAPLADKIALLKRADAAHSHSVHKDFTSYDYYVPKGFNVHDKSAEGAPIYVTGLKGQIAKGDSGGGFGNYGFVLGKDGQILMKSGHGDTAQAVFEGGTFGDAAPASNTGVTATGEMDPKPADDLVKQYVTRLKTGKDVVAGSNDWKDGGGISSDRLRTALQGAQEDIYNQRIADGANFGSITEEVTLEKDPPKRMAGDKFKENEDG
jgi:hypothetical protein